MKRTNPRTIVLIILCLLALAAIPQHPPHPGNGTGPGSSNDPVGGGAPLGSGMAVLVLLAAAYGSRKVFRARRKLLE